MIRCVDYHGLQAVEFSKGDYTALLVPGMGANLIRLADSEEAPKAYDPSEKQLTKQQRAEAIAKLEKEMREASKMLEFEYAAVLRDRIIKLRGQG